MVAAYLERICEKEHSMIESVSLHENSSKYYENLFVDKSGNKVINMTKKIFEEFSFVNNVKKELNLEVFLYNKEATLKIGFDKLYSLNNNIIK